MANRMNLVGGWSLDLTTVDEDGEPCMTDDPCHRHYDEHVGVMAPGTTWRCSISCRALPHAHRRRNMDLCVPRSAFLEPLGEKREAFYEQRLLLGLPWHCTAPPVTAWVRQEKRVTWTFHTGAPHTPGELASFSVTNGQLAEEGTYEGL